MFELVGDYDNNGSTFTDVDAADHDVWYQHYGHVFGLVNVAV